MDETKAKELLVRSRSVLLTCFYEKPDELQNNEREVRDRVIKRLMEAITYFLCENECRLKK